MIHTFVKLEITDAAYDEIETKLRHAGYDHVFRDGVMDMHGIAFTRESGPDVDVPPPAGKMPGWVE